MVDARVIDESGLRAGLSVRTRVIVYLVALTSAALAVAGATAYLIERSHVDATIKDDLTVRTEDFLQFSTGANPRTGVKFASADELLYEGIRRAGLTRDEGAVGMMAGAARYVPAGDDRIKLENDPAFLTAAWDNAQKSIVVRSVTTAKTNYLYTSIPLVDSTGTTAAVLVLATDRGATLAALNTTFRSYALVAVIALIAISFVAYVTVGRLLHPIGLLDRTARRISEADLSERIPIVGRDDLSRLSGTVNAMLDRLERAFADQRQLLDDASHELRTPLTIVRNRLELLEPRDAESVDAARGDLLDEVDAMSRLVDDLVTLAKADRPEFIRAEPILVHDITDATFARAQSLGNRRWSIEHDENVTIVADPQRLTQAWLQLASNAVKFSREGSRIALGSLVSEGWVRLWVRDEGSGISSTDLAHIRERFFRVDPTVEGVGLGLTIVAAIADAHDGALEVASTLGVGSTFTIAIPQRKPGLT